MENPKLIEFLKFVNRLPIKTEDRSQFVSEYTSNLRKEEMVDIQREKYFRNEILTRIINPELELTMLPLVRS